MSTFDVVQAAQRFLLDALPLREPETTDALQQFCQSLPTHGFERVAAETITITVIRKLGTRCGIGADTLVNGYFLLDETIALPDRVWLCVGNLLRGRGVRHPSVAAALRLIETRCVDPHLRLETIARELHVSGSHLAHLIPVHTGERFRSHLRHARMRLAARALRDSGNIREVATSVGYLHPADFNHHFKRQFGITPTMFRARLIAAGDSTRARSLQEADGKKTMARAAIGAVTCAPAVLIVEDDPVTCHTFGLILRDAGYLVDTVERVEHARAAAARRRPAVTIVDRWIGEADGVTLACELARSGTAGRIALVTGDFSLDAAAAAALAACGVRIVFKPLDLEDLVDLVRALARSTPDLNRRASGGTMGAGARERLRVRAKD